MQRDYEKIFQKKRCVYLYSFLICFEYSYVEFFGFDSEYKPYRIIGIIIILLSLFDKKKIDFYDKSFFSLFILGFVSASVTFITDGVTLEWTFNALTLISFSFFVSLAVKNTELNYNELERIVFFLWRGQW